LKQNNVPDLSQMIVKSSQSVKEAINVIDLNGEGVCFIVDENFFLVGILTDGDIRRSFLANSNININSKVVNIMNKKWVSLNADEDISFEKIQSLLNEYSHIPLLDNKGILTDFACSKRFHNIPLIEPSLDGNELEYVTDCVVSGWVSSKGKYVSKFQKTFADYIGLNYSLAVANGTVGLHLALMALGIGPGDEVLVPDLTFAASVNSVIYTGATPVLIDVDPISLAINVDIARLFITKKTKAILPVHLYGHPANMDLICKFAAEFNLFIIEDCAEAIGSTFKGTHVGNFSDVSVFSFFGNKTITTGEGGMVLFKDKTHYIKAEMLRDHGMSKKNRYWHDVIGFNFRMTNLQAAIGLAQIERVEFFVKRKKEIAHTYNKKFALVNDLILPNDNEIFGNSFWLYTLIIKENLDVDLDFLIKLLIKKGIEARRIFYPIHSMPIYKKYLNPGISFPVSSFISQHGICLPSSVNLSLNQINYISSSFLEILDQLSNNNGDKKL
jgi:perosamine synthetase